MDRSDPYSRARAGERLQAAIRIAHGQRAVVAGAPPAGPHQPDEDTDAIRDRHWTGGARDREARARGLIDY